MIYLANALVALVAALHLYFLISVSRKMQALPAAIALILLTLA